MTPDQQSAEPTLSQLAEQYLASSALAALRPSTRRENARVLRLEVLPRLGHLPAERICRKDIAIHLLAQLEDRPGIARNAYTATSAVYRWAMKRGLAEDNPATKIAPPKAKARDRVLTHDEIRLLWHASADLGDYGRVFRLLLLSGCRREEIAALRWDELRDEPPRIELPPERVKNKRAHVVPLTTLAIEQLPQPRGRPWVFGEGRAGFNGWHWGETQLAARIVLEPRFTLHDCRRTIATNLARLGVALPVVERLLNHQSGTFGGVVGIYQKYQYEPEKRAAAELWAAEVARIVS